MFNRFFLKLGKLGQNLRHKLKQVEVENSSILAKATSKELVQVEVKNSSILAKTANKKLVVGKKIFKDYFDEITTFAQHYDVNSMRIGDEYIWPMVRNTLWIHMNFVAINKLNYRNVTAQHIHNARRDQLSLAYRQQAISQFGAKTIETLDEIQADFLFFNMLNSSEQVSIGDEIYLRVTDPLYEEALKFGSALKVALIKSMTSGIEKSPQYIHKSLIILPPHIERTGYADTLVYDKSFSEKMKKYIPSLITLDDATLKANINYDMHTRDYYKDILLKLRPKIVFLYAFHYNYPLISAADELGILTVDIQHGLMVGWNPLYMNYDELPECGYQSLPDHFAVWGDKEHKSLSNVLRSNKHTPIYMGHHWLRRIEDFSTSLRDDLKERLSDNRIKILIIMQNQTSIPKIFSDCINEGGDEILWIVRHHPKKERYNPKDFSTKYVNNIVIDPEIDSVLFNELFKYVDVTISEGSALAIEASYYGVQNIVTSSMGLENYKFEVDEGRFYYMEDSSQLFTILEKIKEKDKASVTSAFKQVEMKDFFMDLLKKARKKKKGTYKTIITTRSAELEQTQKEIQSKNDQMYQYMDKGNITESLNIFYELRKQLGEISDVRKLYEAEQARWIKEARGFKRQIRAVNPNEVVENIIVVSDSLALPRPTERILNNFGVTRTYSYMFNSEAERNYRIAVWAQRYLTTDKLLEQWDEITTGCLAGKHLVIHLGINDSAQRVFLERQRLMMDCLDPQLKKSIVEFGQKYRYEIVANQGEHSYVSLSDFRSNIEKIIERALSEQVKSITFINIIQFPQLDELKTPGCIENTQKYNAVLLKMSLRYPKVKFLDLNGKVQELGQDQMMLRDNVHLSIPGHRILARLLFDHFLLPSEDSDREAFTVAVIGSGKLGSRHLQGLKKTALNLSIEVVEPDVEMQKTSRKLFDEVAVTEGVKRLTIHNDVDSLPNKIDLAIVSTNSDVRATVIKNLLKDKKIKYLILEKVLFQKIYEYTEIQYLILQHGVKVWVNHPRREFDFYQRFLSDLRTSSTIKYQVQGAQWGMASNSLHFLDHLLYLSGEKNPSVTMHMLPDEMYIESAKRNDCYEVFGTIVGNIGKAKFTISCDRDRNGDSNIITTILSEKLSLVIDDYKGTVMYAYAENNWKWSILQIPIVILQSELTGRIAESILLTGSCNLPEYTDALILHEPFIHLMQDVIGKGLKKNIDYAPIS